MGIPVGDNSLNDVQALPTRLDLELLDSRPEPKTLTHERP